METFQQTFHGFLLGICYLQSTDAESASQYSSGSKSAKRHLKKLGRPSYTPEEDELLRKVYPTATRSELTALFPTRNVHGLTQRASQLGIKKDKRFYNLGSDTEKTIIGHLSETDKAYLAGFIDADGCIRLNRRFNNKTHQPVYAAYVQVYTTSPALLEWLEGRFPGISRRERDDRQKEHPE